MKKTLGAMIAELRKAQGMTQLELADKMGVTDKAVSKWERDLSCPDVNSIPKLAEIFGMSVDDLMQVKTDTSKPKQGMQETIDLIFKGVSVAMGVGVVVLAVLDELPVKSGMVMLGIGLACVALSLLNQKSI